MNFIFYVQPLALLGGLFLAHAYRTTKPVTYRSTALPEISRPVAALALLCALGLPVGGLALDGVVATVVQNQGDLPGVRRVHDDPDALFRFASVMAPMRQNNVELRQVIARHDLAVALDPGNPPFLRSAAARRAEANYLFLIKATSGRQAGALTDFSQLVAAFPGLAQDQPLGWAATPGNLLRHAIRFDPTYFPAYRLLAQRYQARGKTQKALDLIDQKAFQWFGIPVRDAQRQRVALMEEALTLSLKLDDNERARALAHNLLNNDPHNQVAAHALLALKQPASATAG